MLWLLIGYIWLFVHRPFEVWPWIGELRVELVYISIVGAIWACAAKKKLPSNPLHFAFAFFAMTLLVCCLLSPWSEECMPPLEAYCKLLVFYVLLVTTVSNEYALRKVTAGFLAAMSLYMLHSLREYLSGRAIYRMGISRMVGVDTTFGDPNAFASSILLSLVLVPALWVTCRQKRARWLLAGYTCLALVCIAFTGSRAAFVGLLLWAAIVIARSRWRWQMAAAALAAAPILWCALPDQLQNRFETIVNPEAGPKNAQMSADSRIESLAIGWDLFQEYPLTGVGPGGWLKATGRKIFSHNLYAQLMGEMGAAGLVAFAVVLVCLAINIRAVRSAYRQNPHWDRDFLYYLCQGLGVGFLLLLFEGNFGHNLFRYHWLWYAAFLIIARSCVDERLRLGYRAEDVWRPAVLAA